MQSNAGPDAGTSPSDLPAATDPAQADSTIPTVSDAQAAVEGHPVQTQVDHAPDAADHS
jgi:hypothetical protein